MESCGSPCYRCFHKVSTKHYMRLLIRREGWFDPFNLLALFSETKPERKMIEGTYLFTLLLPFVHHWKLLVSVKTFIPIPSGSNKSLDHFFSRVVLAPFISQRHCWRLTRRLQESPTTMETWPYISQHGRKVP